jgi:hypothetical protein
MNTAAPENPKALTFSTAPVGTAWRDVCDALSVLFTPALIAFLILLALGDRESAVHALDRTDRRSPAG